MMSKRNNVSYIKPADPKFLQQLKQQIGYKPEPSIDAKRQKLDEGSDSGSDCDEEAPQVVVLKKGDLTAEEAEVEKKRIEREENEKPADLSQRIVFKPKKSEKSSSSDPDRKDKPKSTKPKESRNTLSFQDEDEEE